MSPGIQTRLLAAQSDERLVALVRQGHERAFEAMVHRYRRPLLRYCQRLSLSEARAEDVLQQSLLNAWIALRRGAEVRDLRPWLYRIVHNVAVNSMRGEQPLLDIAAVTESMPGAIEAAASSSTAAAGAASNVDDVLAVRDAFAEMADLPPMQREVMVRTAVGGHSHEEVASALGISDGAVRGLLYRARAQLRAAIAAVMPPPLIAWAVRNAGNAGVGRGAAASERITEIAGGAGAAGGAGLAGLAVKGGIVAITAGAAITGAVVVKGHHPSPPSTATAHATRHQAVASSASAAGTSSTGTPPSPSSPSLSTVLDRSRSSHAGASHRHPHRRGARSDATLGGGGGSVNQAPVSQPIYVAPQPQPSTEPPSGGDHHRSHDHAGGGDRRSSGSSDAPATSAGGDGSHSGDHHRSSEQSSDEAGSTSSDEGGSQSGQGSSGSGSSGGGDGALQQPGGEATQDESQTEEPASGEPAAEGSTEEAATERAATGEPGSDK